MDLVRKINLELGERRGHVFIDEIQRKENAGIFLKGIYDSGLPHKFILSGSGSLELKQTFIIRRLPPYFKNVRKEITKSPKIYFYDLGLGNYPLGLFGNVNNPRESGLLFENFVFNILRERLGFRGESLRFWRTTEKAEVDFVVESGRRVVPIGLKYRLLEEVEVNRSLRSFIETYRPELALIVNLGLDRSLKVGKTKVRAIPFWKLFHLPLFD